MRITCEPALCAPSVCLAILPAHRCADASTVWAQVGASGNAIRRSLLALPLWVNCCPHITRLRAGSLRASRAEVDKRCSAAMKAQGVIPQGPLEPASDCPEQGQPPISCSMAKV